MRAVKGMLKRLRGQKAGTTLVELMVAFVLTAILMTAAIATISPAMRVFYKVVGMSRAQSVTGILLEEMAGQLESARRVTMEAGNQLQYADKNGQGVMILAGEEGREDEGQSLAGMLVLHYEKEDVDWYLPQSTYMGYEITELSFTPSAEKKLVEIKLGVKNKKSGLTYERTRIVDVG